MEPHRTGLYRELDDKLGDESLEDFVRSRRTAGKSWRLISRELESATAIAVVDETLRVWFTYHRQVPA